MSKIRQATLNDLENISLLFDLYRQFYKQPSNLPEANRFLNERLINNESIIFIAEESNGTLSGFTQLYPIFTSVGMRRSWILNDLFVKEDFRKKGIARRLIDRSKQLAIESNAAGLLLETSIHNKEGNSLYPSVGFELERKSNFYYWRNPEIS